MAYMACQLRMDVRDEAGMHVFHASLAFVIEPALARPIANGM
jgi:hypothetical protein